MGKTLNLLCIERNSSEKQEENMNHTANHAHTAPLARSFSTTVTEK